MATATKARKTEPKTVTLAEKVASWRELMLQAEALEEVIKEEILEKGESMAFEGCAATYRKGLARTDYEALGKEAAVETAGFETTKVDWKKAIEAAGNAIPETLKAKHTKDAGPSVSLKITAV